ncbi:MAG: hypothetical protein H0X66_15420 [Verrucomicrobia bacterium]|nr:hypothetical protein [Verrucomicrobiota bacterium]
MFDYLQITAHYSNAVLVAILPYISDFTKKLDLPIPVPVTTNSVEKFVCFPFAGDVGGSVMLTNGVQFSFRYGYVDGFVAPHSYFNLQDPAEIPRFFGPLNLTQEQALQLARESIQKLGYSLEETFTDQAPEVTMPPTLGTNTVPHYLFRWIDPVNGMTAVEMEVDGAKKIIRMMELMTPSIWRSPPQIPVPQKILKPTPPLTEKASNALVKVLAPEVTNFARSLDVQMEPSRITQMEISEAEIRVKLANGFWFIYESGIMRGFTAPNAVFNLQPGRYQPRRPIKEYLGEWRLNETQAIDVARNAIQKAGYKESDFSADKPPDVIKTKQIGKYIVPRFWVRWIENDKKTGATKTYASVEIDASDARIKSIYLLNSKFQREMPEIEGLSFELPEHSPVAPSAKTPSPLPPSKPDFQ